MNERMRPWSRAPRPDTRLLDANPKQDARPVIQALLPNSIQSCMRLERYFRTERPSMRMRTDRIISNLKVAPPGERCGRLRTPAHRSARTSLLYSAVPLPGRKSENISCSSVIRKPSIGFDLHQSGLDLIGSHSSTTTRDGDIACRVWWRCAINSSHKLNFCKIR